MKTTRILALAFTLAVTASQAAVTEKRVALVVGNGNYAVRPLKNPANDARAVAAKLKDLGFDVALKLDARREELSDHLRAFALKAKKADVRLFYYAGHAAQVKGNNYLIPVGEKIEYETEVSAKGIDMKDLFEIVRPLEQGLNIVILDACRDNPYRVEKRSGGNRGLAEPGGYPSGTLIAFATAPGATAEDNPRDSNSVYTRHLLEAMAIPGLPIELVFKRIRTGVWAATQKKQTTWDNTSLMGANFCFVPGTNGKCDGAAPPPLIVTAAKSEVGPTRSDSEDGGLALFRSIRARAETLTADELPSLRQQADAGDALAMTVLGEWHSNHDKPNFQRTLPEAVKWYRRAAEKAYAPAEYLLGWAYGAGLVTGQYDPDTASRFYELSAGKDFAPASWALGEYHFHHGPDYVKALGHYRRAASQGHPGAMAGIALLHLKGLGVAKSISEAEHWARKAYEIDPGNEQAQHILGYLYDRKLIKARNAGDEITLASLRQLKQAFGAFAYGLE